MQSVRPVKECQGKDPNINRNRFFDYGNFRTETFEAEIFVVPFSTVDFSVSDISAVKLFAVLVAKSIGKDQEMLLTTSS